MATDKDSATYIKVGPLGNKSGTEWEEKGHGNIVQIFISHEDEINSLQFQYLENDGLVLSPLHGSNEGFNYDAVKLSYPTEYITYITGYRSSNTGNVCSLTLGTNKGEHGPYGPFTDKDKRFHFWLGEGRQFAGFHGYADDHNVTALGIFLKPITSLDFLEQSSGSVVKLAEDVEKWEMLNGKRP